MGHDGYARDTGTRTASPYTLAGSDSRSIATGVAQAAYYADTEREQQMKTPPPGPGMAPLPRHVPASEIAAFIQADRIDALLTPWLPEDGERALVVRCLLDVGPAHHRGSNYILLRLLGLLLERQKNHPTPQRVIDSAPIPLRVPPAVQAPEGPMQYPLGVPTSALERLAPRGSRSFAAMVDCLTDGPPQHSLANAAMLCLLEALFAASDKEPGSVR